MRHVIERHDSLSVLRIRDDLGSQNATPFREAVDRVAELGFERVVLDFSGVQFMSSMAIAVLFTVHKRLRSGGGDIALSGVGTDLQKILDIVGYPSLVRIFPTEAEAIAHIQATAR